MHFSKMSGMLLLTACFIFAQTNAYHVNTKLGDITGSIMNAWNGEPVLTFRGIPYGKAPIGERRFQHSEPHGSWQGDLNATDFKPVCMQVDGWSFGLSAEEKVSEDCLNLNIYIPGDKINTVTPRSVMVWIYGGGWTSGGATIYDARNLASEGDVIVVTINYRVGLYGFMTTGDSVIPGNMGIGDQILALQWVNQNIAEYGGDPDSITIFGESAGGWSVSVLAVSPLAHGLFHRAISQSGAVMYSRNRTEMSSTAWAIANNLGCPDTSSSNEILNCMKEMPDYMINPLVIDFQSNVCVDGYILPMQPIDVWRHGRQSSVDYMIGVNDGDGTVWLDGVDPTMEFYQNGLGEETVNAIIQQAFYYVPYDDNCSLSASLVIDHYFDGDTSDRANNLAGAIDLVTDFLFLVPSVELSHYALKSYQNVYWYYFTQPPKEYTPAGSAIVEVGAKHADEIAYVFGAYMYLGGESTSDFMLCKSMITAWTSFAKTGTPNWMTTYGYLEEWPKYTWEDGQYLEFNDKLDPDTNVKDLLIDARAKFWTTTLSECDPVQVGGASQVNAQYLFSITMACIFFLL